MYTKETGRREVYPQLVFIIKRYGKTTTLHKGKR